MVLDEVLSFTCALWNSMVKVDSWYAPSLSPSVQLWLAMPLLLLLLLLGHNAVVSLLITGDSGE